jgi:zinc transport system substrate-binding protein
MTRLLPITAIGMLMAALSSSAGAQAKQSVPTVLASTSWTAAIARAAGASDAASVAPADIRHPPEYELKPSDLLKARDADVIVYAGYEKFAQRLSETAAANGRRSLRLVTDNRPDSLIAESAKLAELLGTKPAQAAWAEGFRAYAEAVRERVRAAWPKRRAAVQTSLKAWMEWMGFEVVGVFGPGEPSPAQMLELLKAKPDIVIDNYHNPSGAVLAESLKAPYAVLINFPGKDGSSSLEDVYAYAEKELRARGR